MNLGLGIDTGGTYTDAVIYNFDGNRIIACAKSVTVKEDLTVGINNVLDKLPEDTLKKVKLVSLSTTLATNACVEGKGSRAVLILIGCDEGIIKKYGSEYGLPDIRDIIILSGGHGQYGDVVREPDWAYLEEKILEVRDKTDAYAVVELWGIRNAGFERKAKKLITELTGKQVVCGHELSNVVNSIKRAASTLLNAQLSPLVGEFLNAVKKALRGRNIEAPLVIVRGDGSLMSENFAREKSVETMLSGPSASVTGGVNLTGENNCIIVDMGGTTSDLAIVSRGRAMLADEGAEVGKWKTGTRSILIKTVGLGGDSLIRHTRENTVSIGPSRAAPLSWLTSRWPCVLDKVKKIYEAKKRHTHSLCEFFYLVRDIQNDCYYDEEEKNIVKALKSGPLDIVELSDGIGSSIYTIRTKRLEQNGIIMRCGLTPTDIMHLKGDFKAWSRDGAYYGAMTMADQLGVGLEEMINMVYEGVKEKLYFNIVSMLMENEDENLLKSGMSKQLSDLISLSYRMGRSEFSYPHGCSGFMKSGFSTAYTLVGIGAPVHIFLPDVAVLLGTKCIIPEYAGVANALGAITGNVTVEERIVIKPVYAQGDITGYVCFSSSERKEFTEREEAVGWSREEAERSASFIAKERGAENVDVIVDVSSSEIDLPGIYEPEVGEKERKGKKKILLLEIVVTAKAFGKMKWT